MRVLLIVLANSLREVASEIIQTMHPECEVVTFSKQELTAKPAAELIKLFRGEMYFSAIVFSENLEYQTKLIFLKALLLLIKTKNKKIIDGRDNEKTVALGDFIVSIPLFILEIVLTIAALVALFLVLHVLGLYLKLTKQGERKYPNNNSRNVVFLRSEYAFGSNTGGMARYYEGFVEGIKAWDYNVLFISSDELDVSDASVYLVKLWKIFNSFPDTPQLIYNFRYFWHSYKILRKTPPALLFQISEPYNFGGALLASCFNVPFFLNVHNVDFSKVSFRENIYLIYYSKLVEKVSFLAADAFFAVSSVIKERLLEKNVRAEVIIKHMGVNPDQFKPAVGGSQKNRARYSLGNKIVVGYAGSFFTTHGLEVLAEAIKLVLEKNSAIHFLLLGDGKCYPIVKRFVAQEGFEDNVTLPGGVPLEQIPAHLAVCDICVAPYIQLEGTPEFFGSPSKVFEYMAMQKGVIASDLKPIREVISHGENGLLVKPGNPNELAAAILRLVKDEDLRTKLGEQARKTVMQKYTWETVEGKIIKVYESLVCSN